jgi:hypothetical protein
VEELSTLGLRLQSRKLSKRLTAHPDERRIRQRLGEIEAEFQRRRSG